MRPSPAFQEICDKIEKDPNYGRSITKWQLSFIASHKLKATDEGTVLCTSEKSCNLGRLYNVLKATCISRDIGYGISNWSVSVTQILVCTDGQVSFYPENDFKFDKQLENLSLDGFLGRSHVVDNNMKMAVQYI
jgi:hypothetical protein